MHVTAILLAAGKGRRFKSRISKPMVKLGGRPIIDFSLKTLNQHPLIKDIILTVNPGNIESIAALAAKSSCNKIRAVVLGGARRQDSVFKALKKVSAQSELVLIHDSARPFVKSREISALLTRAKSSGAAILGVPVKATIKQVTKSPACQSGRLACRQAGKSHVTSGFVVEKTLDRNLLWEIQTPQVFRKDWLFEANRKFAKLNVTDDAGLVEKLGKQVVVVHGSYDNIKITTAEDLYFAEAILKARKDQKIWKE
jgi:2-C-methyl-D-erythritol 4-phosphate cytidylyltransferase